MKVLAEFRHEAQYSCPRVFFHRRIRAVTSIPCDAFAAGERVLYSFQGGTDGSLLDAAMITDKAGNLYGTTNSGGTGSCSNDGIAGCGTIFELSPPAQKGGSWTETVLYSFQGGKDGAYPNDPLVADRNGNLFGTTSLGGKENCENIGPRQLRCRVRIVAVRRRPVDGDGSLQLQGKSERQRRRRFRGARRYRIEQIGRPVWHGARRRTMLQGSGRADL